MTGTISERLRDAANFLDRIRIDQSRIISVDVYGGEVRFHVEHREFFREFTAKLQRDLIPDTSRAKISAVRNGMTFFCIVDTVEAFDSPTVEKVA